MSDTVRDTIAIELAAIVRVQTAPVAPFGYGVDMSCSDDIAEDFEDVSPITTLGLAQSIVRRLDCARGALPDDPSYGIDLRSYCNKGTTAAEIRELGSNIRMELTKDDRIASVVVQIVPSSVGNELAISLRVTPTDTRIGVFSMTLAVISAAILLEAMGQ